MKQLYFCLCILLPQCIFPQTRQDSIRLAGTFANWYALDFTESELDSLLPNLRDNEDLYRRMHQLPIPNDLAYPFAFNPAPPGFSMPQGQEPLHWNIPPAVSLPANRQDLAFYSIPELASLIKNKKISSVELTKFFLDRLKKYGDTLHCVISLTEDIAMREARQADADLRRGVYHGPLHGIPYGLKDLFAVKGTRTTWGTTPFKNQSIDQNAFVYEQLKKAGAVLCAKLSMGALANNDLWFGGRTNNPWNLNQGSSGSSAGSAAATAAGLLPFAIGTETWGSIVSPSSRCGNTGLRPTFGSVSRSGAMVLSWSLDKIGPICRSAEDAAIVFSYIKGTDGKDASAVRRPFNFPVKKDLKKLRIAYAVNYFKELPADAPQWKALETFRKLGATLQEVEFPDSSIYPVNIMDPIISAESAAAFDELTRNNLDDMIERQDHDFWPNSFRESRFIPATEYINANRHRSSLIKSFNDFISRYDAVIVPPFSGHQLAITNLTGNPVVVFPVGFRSNGTPSAISILGNLYDESTILFIAKSFQDNTNYHKKHPPLFSNQ